MLTQEEIIQIIEVEINWHNAYYPFSDIDSKYKDGFIEGMKQIQKIIGIAIKNRKCRCGHTFSEHSNSGERPCTIEKKTSKKCVCYSFREDK